MSNLRFAVIGAGFWSNFQLAAWHELEGVECVAVCDRVRAKAEALAQRFGVPSVYDDAPTMLKNERLDFVDVITSPETHEQFVHMAAAHGRAVICQKPMALTLAAAEGMVAVCHQAGVPFFVHENFRWQAPMRRVKQILDEGQIGRPFRARFDMVSGFPVFVNQPSLSELEQFIITDVGSHTLDLARFFFGEASSLYCQTQRVHSNIKGEDIASIMLRMQTGATVQINMGFAENYFEREAFPQTLLFVEGTLGTLELAADYWVRVTTHDGTFARRIAPTRYAWADPAYEIAHSSVVPCNTDILASLRGEKPAETTGDDNLKTVRLVFAAYESAARDEVIKINP